MMFTPSIDSDDTDAVKTIIKYYFIFKNKKESLDCQTQMSNGLFTKIYYSKEKIFLWKKMPKEYKISNLR